MKSFRNITFFLLFHILSMTLCAQTWISLSDSLSSNQSPSMKVLASDAAQYKFRLTINGYSKEIINIDSIVYEQITISDCQQDGSIGAPSFPAFSQLIGVPANHDYTCTISEQEWVTHKVKRVYPVQESRLESDTTEAVFVINDSIYQSTEYIPALYEIGDEVCVSGMYGRTLTITPFRYYPQRGEIDILKECLVTITFSPTSTVNTNLSIKNKKILPSLFSNYNESLLSSYLLPTENEESNNIYDYLIITTEAYKESSALKLFCAWKKIKGHNCKVVSTNDIGGKSSQLIKSYIKEWYEKGVEYVLFVGNNIDIPAHKYPYLNYLEPDFMNSDYWYACVEPNSDSDCFADLAIGRFPITNMSDLNKMVRKTIDYENLTASDKWVTKNLLVAHKEDAPGRYQQCSEEIRTATYNDMPQFVTAYGAADSLGGDNATNDTVVSHINKGFGIVNYRGHGETVGWRSDWCAIKRGFYDTEIMLLKNSKFPIVFNIACKTGNIGVQKLIAPPENDSLEYADDYASCNNMLYSLISSYYGAVAVIGASIDTNTDINNTYNKLLYENLYNNSCYRFGYVNTVAQIINITKNLNDTLSVENAMAYICGGDPSLEIWTDTISRFPNIDVSCESNTVTINAKTVDNYTVTLFSLEDSSCFKKLHVAGKSVTIMDVPTSFCISLNKHNYMPLVYYVSSGDIHIQNENYSVIRKIVGENVYIGSDVTEIKPKGNVIIKSGSNVIIDAKKSTMFDKGFEVEKGSKLYVK